MFGEDILLGRALTNDEIVAALAAAFSVAGEDVTVVDGPIQGEVDADARIRCERFAVGGDFPTHLSVYLLDAALDVLDRMATVRHLCAELRTECLVSDDSVNPYTMLLVQAAGAERAVSLDPRRMDDDEYVIAGSPATRLATLRGA